MSWRSHHDEKEPNNSLKKEKKHHKHLGRVGKVATVAAGAYALHEGLQVKRDPQQAQKHKVKGGVAAAVAVGAAGLTFHAHRKKKDGGQKEGTVN